MANQIIKGKDLMIFDSTGISYAYATSHTLSITTETLETSTKDNGQWNDTIVNKYSWEVTSENLYTESGYESLFDSMVLGKAVTVMFGIKAEDDTIGNVVDGTFPYWTNGTKYYEGKALVTSLAVNASNGDIATINITFTGVGKLAGRSYEVLNEFVLNSARISDYTDPFWEASGSVKTNYVAHIANRDFPYGVKLQSTSGAIQFTSPSNTDYLKLIIYVAKDSSVGAYSININDGITDTVTSKSIDGIITVDSLQPNTTYTLNKGNGTGNTIYLVRLIKQQQ